MSKPNHRHLIPHLRWFWSIFLRRSFWGCNELSGEFPKHSCNKVLGNVADIDGDVIVQGRYLIFSWIEIFHDFLSMQVEAEDFSLMINIHRDKSRFWIILKRKSMLTTFYVWLITSGEVINCQWILIEPESAFYFINIALQLH